MIIGLVGAIGSGKTVGMTRYAYKEYIGHKVEVDNGDMELVTNYKLNGIPFRFIKANELFSLKATLKNARIFIDEMHIFMDSRSSMGKTNKALTHFILQTRHLGVHLYFTTQDISQVDIRLRRQLDMLVYCTQTTYDGWFKQTIIDYRDVMHIRKNEIVYNGSKFYDLYDTTEIIDITESQ